MAPEFSVGPELRALHPHKHAAEDVVRLLRLEPLPQEGGWFRRTAVAPRKNSDERAAWSVILALFTPERFSALHALDTADEIWCFQAGDPLELVQLRPGGAGESVVLGFDWAAGHCLQATVARAVWQGARVVSGGQWSLVSCVVVPEFCWPDFKLGERPALLAGWPEWAATIQALTRFSPGAPVDSSR